MNGTGIYWGGGGGGEYGMCHSLRVLFRLENKFLGLIFSLE